MDDGRSVAEAFDSGTRNFSDVMRLLEDASLQLSNARTMSGVIEKGARRTEYLSLLVRAFVAFRGAPRRRWYSRRAFLCDYSENARDRDTNVSGSRPTAGVRTSPDGRHATGTIGIWLGIAGLMFLIGVLLAQLPGTGLQKLVYVALYVAFLVN